MDVKREAEFKPNEGNTLSLFFFSVENPTSRTMLGTQKVIINYLFIVCVSVEWMNERTKAPFLC